MLTWTNEDFKRLWQEVDKDAALIGVDMAKGKDTCFGSLFLNIPGEEPKYLGCISIKDLCADDGDMGITVSENNHLIVRLH